MNKIEELEHRIRNLEELLNVQATKTEEPQPTYFWDTRADQMPTERLGYKCTKGHIHDSIPDAKTCMETV